MEEWNKTISWKDLDKNDLLILGLKAVCYEELVTLERDQAFIAGNLMYSPSPAIYKAYQEKAEYDFMFSLSKISAFPQSFAWTAHAAIAASIALREEGIDPKAVEGAINKAIASIPLYKPCAEVDFTGFLKSLDEGKGSNGSND